MRPLAALAPHRRRECWCARRPSMAQGFGAARRGATRFAADRRARKCRTTARFAFVTAAAHGRAGRLPAAASRPGRTTIRAPSATSRASCRRSRSSSRISNESNIFTMDDPELFAYSDRLHVRAGLLADDATRSWMGCSSTSRRAASSSSTTSAASTGTTSGSGAARRFPAAGSCSSTRAHPIFHSFFDIDIAETQGYYGPASFHGVFENNDPNKRLLLDRRTTTTTSASCGSSRTPGFVPGRSVERRVQVRHQLHRVCDDALRHEEPRTNEERSD